MRMKRLFKWVLRLVLLAFLLAVVLFLSFDSILRIIAEHSIRRQTGMETEIGEFHLGLTKPVIEIKHLELFNTRQFGGTPFVNIPEIHVEYDRNALRNGQLHVNLLRFNLGELDVVRSLDGQTNILSIGVNPAKTNKDRHHDGNSWKMFREETGLEFTGIDCLNVSVGEFKYIDLRAQTNNRARNIGIDNFVTTNVTSETDLLGLALVVGLRSGDVFKPMVAPGNSGSDPSASDLLNAPDLGWLDLPRFTWILWDSLGGWGKKR
jgi:hypothetical protein